jgi:hypothetical protein
MPPRARRASTLCLLALALTAGCAGAPDHDQSESIDETASAEDELMIDGNAAPSPDAVQMTTLAEGEGWSKVAISGTSVDLTTGQQVTVENEEILIVRGMDGIAAAPLSSALKTAIQTTELAALANQQQTGGTLDAIALNDPSVAMADSAVTAPADANTVPAIPSAPAAAQEAEGETLLFLHKATIDQMEAALAAPPPPPPPPTKIGTKTLISSKLSPATTSGTLSDGGTKTDGGGTTVMYSSSCHDEDWTWGDGWNYQNSLDKTKSDEDGAFTGNLHFQAGYQLIADATVRLRKKRGSVAGVCFTYGFSFKNIELGAILAANASLEANGDFKKAWKPSWQIAKPTLFDQLFFVGPVPVILGMNLPVSAGVDVDAKAQMNLEVGVSGWGAARVICTSSSCQKYTASYLDVDDLLTPGITLTGQAKIKPWVQVAGRVYLYGDSIAYAQAGVRPFAEAHIWGHAGQSCGDANQDGVDDYVYALTASVDVGADVTAEVDLLGLIEEDWKWEIWRKHVGFWSFGPGTAVAPMAWATDPAPSDGIIDEVCDPTISNCGGYAKNIHFRMRPCWPYTSPVDYAITWGSGSVTHHTGSPSQVVTVSPTYSTAGTKTIAVAAESDAHGRAIDESTSLTFQVGPTQPTPPIFENPGGLMKAF